VYENEIDYSMSFLEIFNDDVFVESIDQCFEKQVVVPNFIADNFQEVFYFPRYDDYDVDFLEHPTNFFLSRDVHLHQTNESNHPASHSYNIEMNKVVSMLKEILFLYAFLHLSC
jgi:hypothetical protein